MKNKLTVIIASISIVILGISSTLYYFAESSTKEPKQETVKPIPKPDPQYNFKDDNSIHKFVDPEIWFNNKEYLPENLIQLKGGYIINQWTQLIRSEMSNQINQLANRLFMVFGTKLKVVSAFRSYERQLQIKNGGCNDRFCSKPGHSEHQTWLTIDLFETTSEKEFFSKTHLRTYYTWLKNNAHNFWFHNSYQKWFKVDGYEPEPWHWRFVWIPLATHLKNENLTLSEFYYRK